MHLKSPFKGVVCAVLIGLALLAARANAAIRLDVFVGYDGVTSQGGFFPAMHIRNPRENFFFIFYSEHANTYWIVPSLELVEEANQNKAGANAGKYSIKFCNVTKAGLKPRPRFKKYENAFHLLERNHPTTGPKGEVS